MPAEDRPQSHLRPPQSQPASPNEVGTAIGNVLRQPAFLVTAGALLVAAVFLNVAVGYLQLHFKKEPVALAHELGTIPSRVGTWVQVTQDQPLDSEMQDVLGTNKYIFRDYIDERIVGAGVLDRFKDKSADERRKIVGEIRHKLPNAVISLSVTYYTGMVDTVAHVPDRCVTADGYEPRTYDTVDWPIARDLPATFKPGSDNIKVRYINFEDQTGAANVPRSISYFFHVNGEFACSPLDVRGKLAELWEKKAYYAKIETMTTMDDKDESAKVQKDFLTAVMPEVVRCMPDWDKEHGRAPRAVAAAAAVTN
jgi:hypothetical protein